MSHLVDKYGRELTYLRLSVTDRCNFRCYYCMPEQGIDFAARSALLSFDELQRLSVLFCKLGITKIRITGGEPFVRTGLMDFLGNLNSLDGLDEITITTNGSLLEPHLDQLTNLGIRKINLSLDSLDPDRFFEITRRDSFEEVYHTVFLLLDSGFEVKLNCVVAAGKNTGDIIPFIELTKDHSISVRFLEEMPFNGGDHTGTELWDYTMVLAHVRNTFPELIQLPAAASSTSINYKVPGYAGSFGVIPSLSRTFCGTCNRLRLSATGELRTCLYGPPAVNLRDLLRTGATNEAINEIIIKAVNGREQDGFAAEAANAAIHHSMSVLGG